MKKFKNEKGITLVALIITIVVLLILAVVAIGAVQDSNIIGHAGNAAESYETEKGKENKTLKDAEELLNKYAQGGEKTQEEEPEKGISITPTTLTIKVGETSSLTAKLSGGLTGTISYKSSAEGVATINESGELTGVAAGTTIITATCGTYSATCSVTVEENDVVVGVKAYLTKLDDNSKVVIILTPENKMIWYNEDSIIPTYTFTLVEGTGSWNVRIDEGFTEEYKNNLQFLSSDEAGVFAMSPDRNRFYMPYWDNGTSVIKKELELSHNEELLTKYYNNSEEN